MKFTLNALKSLSTSCVFLAALGLSSCEKYVTPQVQQQEAKQPGSNVLHSLFGKTTSTLPVEGIVVADEPQASIAGRDVLARGGNAVDAAVAASMAMAVTLPSRASFGGGGACLVAKDKEYHAFLFLPRGGGEENPKIPSERPASVPMLARGLYLMQDRFGSVVFSDDVIAARRFAQRGIRVSSQLAKDLESVKTPLFADPGMRAVFGKGTNEKGEVQPLKVGDSLIQRQLGGFLEQIEKQGIGDLYGGSLGDSYIEGVNKAGGGLVREAMRSSLPAEANPIEVELPGTTDHSWRGVFLPPPTDGGMATAIALKKEGSAEQAAALWRYLDENGQPLSPKDFVNSPLSSERFSLPALPASSSVLARDEKGMQVACVLSAGNLFGTGRIAGRSGVVIGTSPESRPAPLYAAGMVFSKQGNPQAIATATGQKAAATALADHFAAFMAHPAEMSIKAPPQQSHPSPEEAGNAIFCGSAELADCRGVAENVSGLAIRQRSREFQH
ncbi:gamma-glutamyltranspeptidase [Lasius niger]|uniref:Gamma-glutamyltranspeptidase n=1 Tax=Lasius niger TaxID=67767 RepID=A0A0J7KQ65_LASNI|nr:gamma-glutamyltranspeptidase [Lasius niger]